MSKGRIGLNFSVNNFPIERNFDVRVNVREDFNYLRYGSSFGLRNVGVSFLDSDPINVNDNIIIDDLTPSVPENSPLIFSEETITTQGYDLPNGKFLITDVFIVDSNGDTIPLYYHHDLTLYPSISNIEVLDGNFDPVNLDLYTYFDETATLGRPFRGIYTNLRSEFDSDERSYIAYYVRFRDNSTNEFILQLLNPKPLYSTSEFATVATDRSYTLTPDFGFTHLQIHFDSKTYSPTPIPNSHRFSIKIDGDNRVSVVAPADLPAEEKWYLRINPGEFFKNTVSGEARYHVPEYFEQLFSPVPPYKLLVEKTARVINSRTLYIEPKPIINFEIDGFYIYVIIRDRFGNTKRALTNDPNADVYTTPSGVITEVFYEKDAIESVSETDGFIRLDRDIEVDADVSITYRYQEDFYTYRGISVNSTINPDVLNNRIVVYCKPELSTSLDRTIYHVLVDEDDLIIDANENEEFIAYVGTSSGGTISTLRDPDLSDDDIYTGFELEILSGDNAGRRLQISAYNSTLKTLTVAEDFESIMGGGVSYRINKRIEDYSFEDPVTSTVFNYSGWTSTYTDTPHHYILLADVFAIQTLSPDSISDTDIRIRGGGVRKEDVDGSLSVQDEVQWYWDVGYWDGQPYPGMGAMLVELPRSILKEVGGNFSRAQVQEIVERHIGHSEYPVVRYYDRSTTITDVQPGDEKILLVWKDVEASSYNVYLGQNPDQLSLYRAVAGVITELDITDLENNKVYYMMVEAVVGGVAQLPSRTAVAIPFNPSAAKPTAIYGIPDYAGGSYA